MLSYTLLYCRGLFAVLVMGICTWPPAYAGIPGRAELPRRHVETAHIRSDGRVIRVGRGGDLQAALDRAAPGDVIALEAGAVYRGPFTLPRKRGSAWITIRTGDGQHGLPPPGARVAPANAASMATLTAASAPIIGTAPGAHHYRFVGVEIRPAHSGDTWQELKSAARRLAGTGRGAGGIFLDNLIVLSAGNAVPGDMPHHIIFDRCYIHGDPVAGARRGIAMNSAYTAVINSYLSDFKMVGADSQAIAGWAGRGPYKIENNYLEGAGENVMFGGADPSIRDLVPSDIVIRHNHFAKPLDWKAGEPGYRNTNWSVKNLFELKDAQRVLVKGNLFEYNWPQSQNGFAILFTVRNQEGTAPWSVVKDVTFSDNIVRHVGSGVNILGHDDNHHSRQTRRIVIRNNLFSDVGGSWGEGQLFQLLDGVSDVVIRHNTAMNTDDIIMTEGRPQTGFVFDGNIVMHNRYGVIGTGTGVGNDTLMRYFRDKVFHNNVIVGGAARNYPSGNYFPDSVGQVGFIDAADGDYRLANSSPYLHVDHRNPAGVEFDYLCAALAATERPPYCPPAGANWRTR